MFFIILLWQKRQSYKGSFQYVKNCFISMDRHSKLMNVVLEPGHVCINYCRNIMKHSICSKVRVLQL